MKKYLYLVARLNWLGAGFNFCAAVLGEPLWVIGAAFCVFGAWLADRMYEEREPV